MGCNISKLHGPEVVLRCRRRKSMIRDAVKYRREFASAHSAYIQVLIDVGSALYKFSDRQLSDLEISPSSNGQSRTLPQTPVAGHAIPSKFPNLTSTSSIFPMNSPSSLPTQPPIHIDVSKNNTEQSKDDKSPNEDSALPLKAPKNKLLSPIKQSAGLDSIHAHQMRQVSPCKSFDSPSNFSSPARSLPYDIMDILFSSSNSSPSVSASETSIWDPFHILSSPRPSPIQEHLMMDIQSQESDHNVELAKADGMPDLEEDRLDSKLEQLEIDKVEKDDSNNENIQTSAMPKANEVEKTNVHIPQEKIGTVKSDDENNNNNEKGVKITEALHMKGHETRNETIDASRKKVTLLCELTKKLNDVFMEASQCGNEVSMILEIQTADQPKSSINLNESFRFARTAMRHWPHKVPLDWEGVEECMDTVNLDPVIGSHSSTLETLYAWEKKLYKEVKVWEHLRAAYVRKCKQFNVFDHEKRDANLIEETRATMEGLNFQLAVAFDAISSTSARIEQLTTKELYPQLVELLKRLMNMWKGMHQCHMAQKTVALQIQTLNQVDPTFKTSNTHITANCQLRDELRKWQEGLSIWLKCQQKYINFLLDWIRVCHMEPEINVMASVHISPIVKTRATPIYTLASNWNDSLIWLTKYFEASSAIYKFSEALHALQLSEVAELKHEEMLKMNSDHRGHPLKYTRNVLSMHGVGSVLQREDNVLPILKKHLLSVFEMLSSLSSIAVKEYEELSKIVESSGHYQNFSSRGPY